MPPVTQPDPTVSVVVATYARAHLLPRLIGALEGQDNPPRFELVIVDDGSPDDTWDTLQRLADASSIAVRPLRLDANRGPAAARNHGWRSSPAQQIAFTDDDCAPEPGWLRDLVGGLAGADIAQGRTIPDPRELDQMGPFSRSLSITEEDGFYQTCNVAYRRRTLEQAGGFDEAFRFPAGEDTNLAWRARAAGATTCFRPDAVVRHAVRPSNWSAAARDTWRWQSIALAVKRNPRLRDLLFSRWIWRRSHLLAGLAGLGLAFAAVASALAPALWVGLAWLVAVGLSGPYVRYRTRVAPLPTLGPRRRWLLLPAAFALDCCEVLACMVGSLRHRTLVL
ncbi:MAG: glycosyltransferase family 2 protein [Mycobacteriales bacterium]